MGHLQSQGSATSVAWRTPAGVSTVQAYALDDGGGDADGGSDDGGDGSGDGGADGDTGD